MQPFTPTFSGITTNTSKRASQHQLPPPPRQRFRGPDDAARVKAAEEKRLRKQAKRAKDHILQTLTRLQDSMAASTCRRRAMLASGIAADVFNTTNLQYAGFLMLENEYLLDAGLPSRVSHAEYHAAVELSKDDPYGKHFKDSAKQMEAA